MKYRTLFRFMAASALIAGVFPWLFSANASAAQAGRKNPTSKLFVSDLTGDSQIDTGEKIEPLTKKAVHSAEATVIETKPEANDSLVLSNGTALYLGPATRLEIKKFQQEPFSPNRNDLDIEPSISQTLIKVPRGSVGICTSKLVAGSAMVYTTPHATINIRGRRLLLEVDEGETRVYLLEGDITVLGESAGNGETLRPGQFAIIRRASPDQPAVVTVAPIPDDQNSKIDDRVALACISRRTVYFESANRSPFNGDDAEIKPVEVVPAKAPTQFTVSPSRIKRVMNGHPAYVPFQPRRSRLPWLTAILAVGLGTLSSSALALIKFDDGHDEIFVTLGLGLGYDSNIFATANGGGDSFASASLDLEYRRKAGLIGVDGSLGWNFSKFDRFGSEDFANPHLRLEFTKDKGRTTGSLQLSAARESRAETEINIRTTSWDYDANLNLKYPVIERYSLTGQVGYNLRDYVENVNLVDIRTFSVGSDLNYAYTSARDLVAGYRFRATDTTAHSESYDHSFTVGTSGKLLSKLNGSARFGYQIRQSNRRDGQDGSYGDFTAAVSTTWTLTRRFSLTGGLSRDFSTLATDTSVETTAANLDAQFAAKAKFSLFAGVGGGYTRFLGVRDGSRRDTYFNFNAGANYTMNDHLKLTLAYGYYKNWSTLPISDYDRHTISLNVSSRW